MFMLRTHGMYPDWLNNAYNAWVNENRKLVEEADPRDILMLFEVAHNIKLDEPNVGRLYGVKFASESDATLFLLRWS